MSPFTPAAELGEFPIVTRWPVQWGDQDAFGHVNNTIYFRWFESARIEYLDQLGLGGAMAGHGLGPILASIGCQFKRQVRFPDTMQIGTRVSRIGRTSMTVEHCLYSETQQTIVALGDSTIVLFDYDTQRPQPIPAELRARIEQLESRTPRSAAKPDQNAG